jgi:aromatase
VTAATSTVMHTATMRAAPGDVYSLVADVTRWPVVFGPTVHVEHLYRDETTERFAIWALVNGRVVHWTSARTLDPAGPRIDFKQEHSMPPVASMGGTWEFRDWQQGGTQVLLRHEFATTDGSADGEASLREALDRNSDSELGALRQVAESGYPADALIFEFEDAIQIAGPAAAAYEFIDRADQWHRRLPHVRQVSLEEPAPGIQHLTMETVTADDAAHTTSSVRVCTPNRWIAYKQTVAPVPLLGHSGTWSFRDLGDSACHVVARHLVMLDPALLSPEGTGAATSSGIQPLSAVAGRVKAALSGNSMATLEHARKFAEQA